MNPDLYRVTLCRSNENDYRYHGQMAQKEIEKLKTIEKWREAGLLDENDNPIPAIPDIETIKKMLTTLKKKLKQSC